MSKFSHMLALAALVFLTLAAPALASGSYTWTWNGWEYTIAGDSDQITYTNFTYKSDGRVDTVRRTVSGCTGDYSLSYSGSAEPYTASATFYGTGCPSYSPGAITNVRRPSAVTPSGREVSSAPASVSKATVTVIQQASSQTAALISGRIASAVQTATGIGRTRPVSDADGDKGVVLASSQSVGQSVGQPVSQSGLVKEAFANPGRDRVAASSQDVKNMFAPRNQRVMGSFNEQSLAAHFNKNQDTGLSAGDEPAKIGLWGVGSYANMQDFQTDTRYEGNLYMFVGGLDYKLTDQLLVGAAAGYETVALNTVFNQGNMGTQGYTITPYAGYKITDTLTVDALGGITFVNYDTKRSEITGHYQAVRNMWNVNLNKYFLWDNWTFAATIGNMFVNEHSESFSESDGTSNGGRENYLSELRLGGKASYVIGKFEAYSGMAYLLDYMMRYTGEMPDNDAFEGTLGLNYRPADNWTLGLEGANTFDRAHTQSNRVMANIRYEF